MTSKHAQKPKKTRGGSADKVWAVGLAGATCLGLVGVVGARTAQDAAASPVQEDATLVLSTTSTMEAVSSSGLTEAQLDEYARALEAERVRLEAYHAELLDVAARLQHTADSVAQAATAVPAATKATQPKASSSSSSTANSTANSKANSTASKPASKASKKSQKAAKNPKPATQAQSQPAAQPQPQSAAKPAPVAKPAPAAKPAPQQQAPQATTRGS